MRPVTLSLVVFLCACTVGSVRDQSAKTECDQWFAFQSKLGTTSTVGAPYIAWTPVPSNIVPASVRDTAISSPAFWFEFWYSSVGDNWAVCRSGGSSDPCTSSAFLEYFALDSEGNWKSKGREPLHVCVGNAPNKPLHWTPTALARLGAGERRR